MAGLDKFKVGDIVIVNNEIPPTHHGKIGMIGIVERCDGDGSPVINVRDFKQPPNKTGDIMCVNQQWLEKVDWVADSEKKV